MCKLMVTVRRSHCFICLCRFRPCMEALDTRQANRLRHLWCKLERLYGWLLCMLCSTTELVGEAATQD